MIEKLSGEYKYIYKYIYKVESEQYIQCSYKKKKKQIRKEIIKEK